MQTKMNVYITIESGIKSRELYERLRPFKANVTDMGDKVYVYMTIDLREDTIEKVLTICHEYGDCSVDAHMVKEKGPQS